MSDVTLKRIIDLETQSEVDSSVYTIIDSPTGMGKKYPLGNLVGEVDNLKQDFNDITDEKSFESKNLFNPNAEGVVTGKYLDTSGNLQTGNGWNTTDYIDVSGLESIVGSVWSADDSYVTYSKLNFLHIYGATKNHLGKVWDTSPDGVYTVGENVKYIRFCWQPNNELVNGRKMMVESGTTHSSTYEAWFAPYTATFIDPDALEDGSIEEEKLSPDFINRLSNVLPPENDIIVFWGDSLTYSQYASDDAHRYPAILGTLANKTTKNFGMPGANSMDISGLQGGMPIYLDPFTLPADTSSVTVTLRDANGVSDYIGLLHHMPRGGWVNSIQAMDNSWLLDGIPVMLSYVSPNMKVYRLEAGEEAITFDRPVKLTSVNNWWQAPIQVFWVGTNDAPDTAEKAQRTVDVIQNMVKYYSGFRYLVLGMTVKSYADATNNIMGQTFGNHYVDVKDYLIKYGLDDNSITPTEQDTTDISNGVVPTSLRYDSVHFNDYGYNAIANCVYRHGKDLGYWS